VSRPNKSNIGKVRLFAVSSDTGKELVYGRLRISEPGPGYCHFPISYPDEYFSQLTAEKLVTRYVRGHAKRMWVKARARNEALDVRVYALAAYSILGMNVNTIAAKMERANVVDKDETVDQMSPLVRKGPQRKRGGGGFANSWR
jgi:phage terminase large subunit GpA-like protein